MTIDTSNLNVRNGGLISVGNTKLGNAGNLNISANTIRLENGGSLNAELKNNSEINAQVTVTATDRSSKLEG